MKIEPLVIGDLTVKIPVMQGGMGVGVSLSNLAGAVAAQGGIGILSAAQIGYRDADFDNDPIACNLRAIKTETDNARKIANGGIIGINIMVATKYYEEYVKAALEAGVDLIVSGAGLPMNLPELAGNTKTKLVPIVSSVKSLHVIVKYWMKKYARLPDAVVIEGPLAGGHLGFTKEQLANIDALHYDEEVKSIIEKVRAIEEEYHASMPVIMAGGIYTRQDMEHYMEMGAAGVQMATRFVTTYECDADDAYKQSYIKAKKEDIVIVQSPVGMPGRAILNPFMQRAKQGNIPHEKCHLCISTCKPAQTPYCITDALVNAAKGNVDDALLFCGANAYRATKLEYVKDIMEEFKP
ncbi:MAG: nitronate monooxygenase family protein [Bacillus sp. (in: Bacteria)]|nr:nitronate monooxygenase family protein [Bacillus sp. (in: firmicutes)]MCM1426241.1 nitronate monooxygenase family protein [Eubacterium sp.]